MHIECPEQLPLVKQGQSHFRFGFGQEGVVEEAEFFADIAGEERFAPLGRLADDRIGANGQFVRPFFEDFAHFACRFAHDSVLACRIEQENGGVVIIGSIADEVDHIGHECFEVE